MSDKLIPKDTAIKTIVQAAVKAFAEGFRTRHEGQIHNPDGTINMKIHNVFIAKLGPEIQYYTALVRSFDSSLGNMLEKMAIDIATLSFDVHTEVEGYITIEQVQAIAELLEKYKSRAQKPTVADYQYIRDLNQGEAISKRHNSDYYLIHRIEGGHYLIELKIGGDLDNKKARSEKEAILEQYAILSNNLKRDTDIYIRFATAYNRFGENKTWSQTRVKQFFADEELLIGRDFWNFICQSDHGYDIVLGAYQESAQYITDALESIKRTYLDD